MRYQGRNLNFNTKEILSKRFKKGMNEEIRMLLIIVEKRIWSNLSESLINLIVAVSILIFMLLSKFLPPYIITWSRSFSFKDIMES